RLPAKAANLELNESAAFVQAEQPLPQPPTAASASPSSTWKECPQPQDETAFGLLMAKPDCSIESTKSISAPMRYGALNGSTTTCTPCASNSWSPSTAPRSNPSPYWKPEQPPPWIATRSTLTSVSSAISCWIFSAAAGVTDSRGVVSTRS